jgi:uncharacterized protein (DUF2336 family)
MNAKPPVAKPAEPSDASAEFQELVSLARDKSVAGRSALVKALGDLFYDSHSELSGDERDMMGEILQRLIGDMEEVVRKALAETLSGLPEAPP